jgi:DNA primase
MSVIDEVKQKLDIVEVIGQYVSLKKAGRNLAALCPFHSEKNPSFYVYPEQQSWHCFGACSTGGDVFSFIMKKENIDFGEALRLLAQRVGVTIPSRFEPDIKRDEKERIYQVNETAAQYFHNLLLNSPAAEKARDYLNKRGLSKKAISDFQLGYSLNSWEALKQYLLDKGYTGDEILEAGLIVTSEDVKIHDRFRNKLMFPISDARGRVTGFGARVLDDSLPKYINSPQTPVFDKSGTIYGINFASSAVRQQNLAVIVEGYMDVITAHQNGFSNVIASMGTAITEKQVTTLKRLTRNIVLSLDADSAGEEAMLRCVDYENSLDIELRVVILPEGQDPDDVIKEDTENWQQLIDKALPIVDYTFNMVTSGLDLNTASAKRNLVDRLVPVVIAIQDPIRRAHYVQKLARLTEVTERTIEATLNKIKTTPGARRSKAESMTHAVRPLLSRPIEEQCLALILKHPELKIIDAGLKPEYFENSENREIYIAWQQADNLSLLKENLDTVLWDYVDTLVNKDILVTRLEERYNRYVLRLHEEYLRGLERKRAVTFTLEAEVGGTAAELAKLEEQGIEPSKQLREIFDKKAGRGGENLP